MVVAIRGADATHRAWAAAILGRFGPAARPAVATLVEARSDPDGRVREEAARALEEIAPALPDPIGPDQPPAPGSSSRAPEASRWLTWARISAATWLTP